MKKPDGAGILAVRTDAIGWGGGLLIVGIGLHIWSNATLARAERDARSGSTRLVTEGPFQYVRHPIYLTRAKLLCDALLALRRSIRELRSKRGHSFRIRPIAISPKSLSSEACAARCLRENNRWTRRRWGGRSTR